jgi:hypothetical protein
MKSRIAWTSTSAADDAALEGLRDFVSALGSNDYRLIGGLALSLLIQAASDLLPAEVTRRSTADNDAALTEAVLATSGIDNSLRALAYTRTAGNRWERRRSSGEVSAIDIVVPSLKGRRLLSRNVGNLVVDALPGVLCVLHNSPVPLEVCITLRSGVEFDVPVKVSSPLGLVVSKAFACDGRSKDTDWTDMWRALEVANSVGFTAEAVEWEHPEAIDAAAILNRHLLDPNTVIVELLCPGLGAQARQIRTTRVRALTQRLVPKFR